MPQQVCCGSFLIMTHWIIIASHQSVTLCFVARSVVPRDLALRAGDAIATTAQH